MLQAADGFSMILTQRMPAISDWGYAAYGVPHDDDGSGRDGMRDDRGTCTRWKYISVWASQRRLPMSGHSRGMMAGNEGTTGGMIGGNMPTTICVTDGDTASTLRSMLTPRGMRVGNVRVRDGVDVIMAFEAQLARHRDDIDAIVLSQNAVEHATGRHDALLRECIKLANAGIPKGIVTFVIDERHVINDRGVQALRKAGITVTSDAVSCATALAKTFRLTEPLMPQDDGTASDGNVTPGGTDDERRTITAKDVALGDYDTDFIPNDPFGDLRENADAIDDDDGLTSHLSDASDDDDTFDYDDDDYSVIDDDAASYDDIDPFAGVRDGVDPFASLDQATSGATGAQYGYDDDDERSDDGHADDVYDGDDDEMLPAEIDDAHRYDGKSGEGTEEDVRSMIAPTYGNPTWDYSEINEGIREQRGGRLFGKMGGKRGGRIIGETDKRMMYANSRYIADRTAKNGGYDPPTDCKIITCYSNIGGSGKTTVSTMIGAQLVWDFDRDLLERRSSNMAYRILVLSLNEFDDIEVKGIGTDGSSDDGGLLASNEGRDVLALKQKIAECNGDPTWDDIAHCFKASPMNYVMYLPSMTLREKFETRQEIDDQDYKSIISVCRRFFNFIIIDTPDVMYNNKYELIPYALSIADVVCLIMTPDAKSTYHMYNFLDGMKAGTPNGSLPFARDQTMLVVNKVATSGNPYVGHTNSNQVPFKDIANTFTKIFFKVLPIPMTDQNMDENIMFGYDSKVKEAASDITDTILEMIDRNDHANGF